MRTAEWDRLEQGVLAFYRVARRPATATRVAKVLREVAEFGDGSPNVTTTQVASWVASRPDRAPLTWSVYLSYLRAALSFALDEGWCERVPVWRRLKQPLPPRAVPRHLTAAELRRLIGALGESAASGEFRPRRLLAAVSTIAYTGLRRSEALFLRVDDLDLATGLLRVRSHPLRPLKTPWSAQPVPVAPELESILRAWLPFAGEPWLFPGERRRGPWAWGSAGRQPVDELLAAAKGLGLGRVTWSTLRHTWATQAESRWGLTAPQIQRVLRHTSPRTQGFYCHSDDANLAEIGRRISLS